MFEFKLTRYNHKYNLENSKKKTLLIAAQYDIIDVFSFNFWRTDSFKTIIYKVRALNCIKYVHTREREFPWRAYVNDLIRAYVVQQNIKENTSLYGQLWTLKATMFKSEPCDSFQNVDRVEINLWWSSEKICSIWSVNAILSDGLERDYSAHNLTDCIWMNTSFDSVDFILLLKYQWADMFLMPHSVRLQQRFNFSDFSYSNCTPILKVIL